MRKIGHGANNDEAEKKKKQKKPQIFPRHVQDFQGQPRASFGRFALPQIPGPRSSALGGPAWTANSRGPTAE